MFLSVPVSSIDYVPRPTLEAEILAVYNNKSLQSGSYYIVYGVKGAGKTSVVTRVLGYWDLTGVVAVRGWAWAQSTRMQCSGLSFFRIDRGWDPQGLVLLHEQSTLISTHCSHRVL
jgi:hypothetical protein